MIAGCTRAEADAAFVDRQGSEPTGVDEVRQAFSRLGMTMSGRRGAGRKSDRRFFEGLADHALLRVPRGADEEYWHWVVWNAKSKTIFDPMLCKDDRRFPSRVDGYYVVTRP
jgi:hypothetical protein